MSKRHRKPTVSTKKVAKITFTAAGSQRADHAGSGGRCAGARAGFPLNALPVKAQYIVRAGVLGFIYVGYSDAVELTVAQVDELRELIYCADVPATVGTRARIVLWFGENRPKKEIAAMAGVSRPTVNLWLSRYEAEGVAGLLERKRGAGREQVPATIRAKILAATRSAPPEGLSHWSSREMVKFIARTEKVTVSHHYVATLWRETG